MGLAFRNLGGVLLFELSESRWIDPKSDVQMLLTAIIALRQIACERIEGY